MPKKHTFDYDLIVIGSGAGGSAAATISARAGKKVAIVEADVFGGDSPNYGDVPVKALLHAVHLYDEAKQGSRFGLRSSTLGYNYPSLREWKNLAIKRTGAGNNRRFYETHGVDAFSGRAHFLSPHEISVGRSHLSAAKFLIATGSEWTVPDIQGIENSGYLTPRTLLDVTRPPKSLLVIGAGQIGVELTQLMASLGTKVYLTEIASRILPHIDESAGDAMAKFLHAQKGVSILTQARIVSVVKDGLGKRVTIQRGGVEKQLRVDDILITAGRTPSVDVGLENAGVAYTPKGISVSDTLQTNVKHIYAAGDVLGRTSHTHSALLESRVAAHNMLHKTPMTPDYTGTPGVIYTHPGIAYVGLSEDDCTRRDLAINKATVPLSIIARSNTSDFRDGFVKLISDKKGVIIGATLMAPHAAEMIEELALAVKFNLTAQQLADTPHAFLSWSEAIRVAAAKLT